MVGIKVQSRLSRRYPCISARKNKLVPQTRPAPRKFIFLTLLPKYWGISQIFPKIGVLQKKGRNLENRNEERLTFVFEEVHVEITNKKAGVYASLIT
jgi:hypothetical protein